MHAVVVYESMFGNTRDVARAVADGLATVMDVQVSEVGSAPRRLGHDVGLLVVGAPTHAFSLSRPSTRDDARRQAGGVTVSAGIGLREWLDELAELPPGLCAAAFDTRVSRPRVPGGAARAAHKRLRRPGVVLVSGPETFWVRGTRGPLDRDELTRANQWGAGLAARTTGRHAATRA